MIYGLNFNGTHIPEGVRRKFVQEKKLPGMLRGQRATLQGVGQSPEERDVMIKVAQRPGRMVHIEERVTAGAKWYGIYTYSTSKPQEEWYGR